MLRFEWQPAFYEWNASLAHDGLPPFESKHWQQALTYAAPQNDYAHSRHPTHSRRISCRQSNDRRPTLKQLPNNSLQRRDVLFATLASNRTASLVTRLATQHRCLQMQGTAEHHAYANFAANETASLPAATLLEVTARVENGRSVRQRQFIAQKQLEMLVAMHNEAKAAGARRHRWYMLVDDDTFVYVDRLVELLGELREDIPLAVGGGQGRSRLDSGHERSIFNYHAGGIGMALNARALELMAQAIAARKCVHAEFSDAAFGACAIRAGVPMRVLPDGWLNRYIKQEWKAHPMDLRFPGRLITVHRLQDRLALCFAQELSRGNGEPECARACRCECTCVDTECRGCSQETSRLCAAVPVAPLAAASARPVGVMPFGRHVGRM